MNKSIWCVIAVCFGLATDMVDGLSKKYSEMSSNEKMSFLQKHKDVSNFDAVKNDSEKAKIFLSDEIQFQNWM